MQTKEQQAISSQKHYAINKEKVKARARVYTVENRLRLKEYVGALKAKSYCLDCGESDPVVLEFDHIGGNKVRDISTMMNRSVSLKTLKVEIAKCELVCANCHRRRTHRRNTERKSHGYRWEYRI